MVASRREFIRQIGLLLASLTTAHCTPLPGQGSTAHDRLRKCWLGLDELEKTFQKDYRGGQETGERLRADHRAALDELVEAGELDAASAEHVQLIFDEAAYHIERSMATCYEAMPMPDYVPAARGQVMQQTDLLAEMAEKGTLDPQTVARAQAALERDAAFLNLSEEEKRALYTKLAATGPAYPPFDELDLEIAPEAAEAAAFLAQLLSGQ